MKFGIVCKVDSRTKIGKTPILVSVNGIDFTLKPTEQELLGEITAVVAVENSKRFTANIAPSVDTSKSKLTVSISPDKNYTNELVELMQYIESSLSFLIGVKKIYWEDYKSIFIPENEEEKQTINIQGFETHKEYQQTPVVTLTAGAFKKIIDNKDKYRFLTVAKSFHKEGTREFDSFRYINAYYNFYFVLEDLFGEGKTKNKDVEQKFKSNQNFRKILQEVLDTSIDGRHKKNIEQFIKEESKSYDIDGIIELIVRVRGNLHHFSSKSTKRTGSPLNQRDFESMAYLLLALSVKSIILAMVESEESS